MTTTTYYTATSLDGFIADPGDSLDWLFEQEAGDLDDGPFGFEAFSAGIGAVCMGRTTWDWIAEHDEGGWADERPTWVFTHREAALPDRGSVRFASGEVAPVHTEMAQAAGDKGIWVVGGGDLAAAFASAGLLDEVVVSIAAVTLGAGRPLLGGAFDLRPLDVARSGAFVCVRYGVVGARSTPATAPSALAAPTASTA
jgi:dihydrofolate reductase